MLVADLPADGGVSKEQWEEQSQALLRVVEAASAKGHASYAARRSWLQAVGELIWLGTPPRAIASTSARYRVHCQAWPHSTIIEGPLSAQEHERLVRALASVPRRGEPVWPGSVLGGTSAPSSVRLTLTDMVPGTFRPPERARTSSEAAAQTTGVRLPGPTPDPRPATRLGSEIRDEGLKAASGAGSLMENQGVAEDVLGANPLDIEEWLRAHWRGARIHSEEVVAMVMRAWSRARAGGSRSILGTDLPWFYPLIWIAGLVALVMGLRRGLHRSQLTLETVIIELAYTLIRAALLVVGLAFLCRWLEPQISCYGLPITAGGRWSWLLVGVAFPCWLALTGVVIFVEARWGSLGPVVHKLRWRRSPSDGWRRFWRFGLASAGWCCVATAVLAWNSAPVASGTQAGWLIPPVWAAALWTGCALWLLAAILFLGSRPPHPAWISTAHQQTSRYEHQTHY